MLLVVRRVALAIALLAGVVACSNGKSGAGASPQPSVGATGATGSAAAAATPDCHGESAVWASSRHKTYVLPGNARYGKGKSGRYMCLSDAESRGYHEGRGGGHRRRHRHSALNP